MGKYFGTDGVRGRANDKLTLDMAVKIGQYIGYYFGKQRKAKIVIGKDTRLSSDMFEMAISAGAISTGANVYLIGVCPTPCVSYLIQKEKFDCGVMISASHNPYYDNGIKLFNFEGKKMDANIEELIEEYMDGNSSVDFASDDHIGKAIDFSDGLVLYESRLKGIVDLDISDIRVALDLANGSATSCALDIFDDLGVTTKVIHSTPNGVNINYHCGSTHPGSLQELVAEGNYDVGFAFDGDADRLIAVNEDGELFDGDHILYVCSKYLRDNKELKDNMVVTTVMANLGLYKALEKEGIDYKQTAVGDKYVFEEMENNDYILGGEQSGHIIFKKHSITGDGILSALILLEVMKKYNKSLKELSENLFIYPQLLINVPVNNKEKALEDESLNALVQEVADELGCDGRILVRPSGTEPLVRVMVEAQTDALCERHVNRVVEFIKSKGL